MDCILTNIYTKKFILNNKKEQVNKKYNVTPKFAKKIYNIDDNHLSIELMFIIQETEEEETPFNLELSIVGEFKVNNVNDEEVQEFINIRGIQMIFPYLRSTLSSSMAALMMKPILLPIMDVSKIFK